MNLRVALLEREPDLMQRASYVNQARIHQGYHYPRSILTGLRSRVNFDRFITEYSDCVHSEFSHYYAIARIASKVSAQQFRSFCKRIGAPLQAAPRDIKVPVQSRYDRGCFPCPRVCIRREHTREENGTSTRRDKRHHPAEL